MSGGEARFAVGLDLMRAAAATLVFAAHLRGGSFVELGALDADQRTFVATALFAITRLGREAVLTFFVLSGYLVGGQLVRAIADGTFRLSDYAIDRATRILLPLVPACLLTAGIGVAVFAERPDLLQVIGNMIGLNGLLVATLPLNSPLWSLSCEIWFYITGGALGALFCRPAKRLAMLVLAIAAMAAWMYGPDLLVFWFIGGAVAVLPKVRRPQRLAIIGTALFLVGSISVQISGASRSFTSIPTIPPVMAELLICAGVAMMLPLTTSSKTSEYLSPFRTIIGALSARSYTLYLVHHPIINAFRDSFPAAKRLDGAAFHAVTIRIIAVIVATEIMFFLFEKRTAVLRKALRRRVKFRQNLIAKASN